MEVPGNKTQALDWREQILRAVAYRMVERDKIDVEAARFQVRDVMNHGYNSLHIKPVGDAAVDLFRPILGSVLPILPQLASSILMLVQKQNERGEDMEQRLKAV